MIQEKSRAALLLVAGAQAALSAYISFFIFGAYSSMLLRRAMMMMMTPLLFVSSSYFLAASLYLGRPTLALDSNMVFEDRRRLGSGVAGFGSDYNDAAKVDGGSASRPLLCRKGQTSAMVQEGNKKKRDGLSLAVFGGEVKLRTVRNDTWTFDLMTRAWQQRVVPGQNQNQNLGLPPPPILESRWKNSLVRTRSGTLLLFGGSGFAPTGKEVFFNDLWELDLAKDAWTLIHQGSSSKNSNNESSAWPDARRAHTGVLFDANTMVIFGGKNGAGKVLDDAWAYDIPSKTFRRILAPFPAQPRKGHSAAMIGESAMLVFGGRKNAREYFNDVVALERSSAYEKNDFEFVWKVLHRGDGEVAARAGAESEFTVPSKRNHHGAAVVQGRIMVIFGGRTSHEYEVNSIKSDLWSFDTVSREWKKLHHRHRSDKKHMLPWPLGRFEHTMECASSDKVLVFGGQGVDGKRRNDVWQYSVTDGSWEELYASSCSSSFALQMTPSEERSLFGFTGAALVAGFLLLFARWLKISQSRRGYTSL